MNLLPEGPRRPALFESAWKPPIWLGQLLLVITCTALGAAESPSLRDWLTPEEFHRAGLDKLTSEELRFLAARLAAADIAQTPAPTPASPVSSAAEPPRRGEAVFGQEEQLRTAMEKSQQVPTAIQSRILGVFAGWEGKAEFRLENGQIWRQIDDGRFAVHLTNPVVVIEKGALGAYYLHVAGYGSRAKVVRVR